VISVAGHCAPLSSWRLVADRAFASLRQAVRDVICTFGKGTTADDRPGRERVVERPANMGSVLAFAARRQNLSGLSAQAQCQVPFLHTRGLVAAHLRVPEPGRSGQSTLGWRGVIRADVLVSRGRPRTDAGCC